MQYPKNANLILQHLDVYGVRDKDAIANKIASRKKSANVATRRGVARKTLDLHGARISEAIPLLRDTIEDCKSKGIKELLVIHGYGRHSKPGEIGVLKSSVLDFLEERLGTSVKTYVPARPKDGGEGATLRSSPEICLQFPEAKWENVIIEVNLTRNSSGRL